MPDAALAAGAEIALSADQSHYLVNVLRLAAGAEVHLFNAAHGEWEGEIGSTKKGAIKVVLKKQTRAALITSSSFITLAFAPLKKTRTDFVVEKASELGVHALQPILTDHTQAERVNIGRLQSIAIEAAEQCDRLDAPTVLSPIKLSDYLQSISNDAVLFLAAEAGDALPIATCFEKAKSEIKNAKHIHFLIGPEGGFSDAEFERFDRYSAIRRLKLGPRLLRAETAALAVLSAYQAILGDWVEA